MTSTLIVYVGMVVVLFGAFVVLYLRDQEAARAAEEASGAAPGEALRRLPEPIDDAPAAGLSNRIDQKFRRLIFESGLDLGAEAAFLLMVLVGLLVGGAIFVWRDEPVPAIAGILIGMGGPLMYYMVARGQRLKAIREQLPDCMDLMSRAVRAGETLDQAIESAGRQTANPLGIELRRAASQLEMGLSMPSAMRGLTRRAPISEVRILSAAFNVQRRSGGNLAVMLDRLARVVRDRLSYQRQFIAATGAGRLATIMISLAGPLVFTYMLIFQPSYMGNFFSLPGGTALLATAIALQLAGLVWVVGVLRNSY